LGLIGAVAAAVAIAVGAWLLLQDDTSAVAPLPAAEAGPASDQACGLMRRFEQQVRDNAPAKEALASLDAAVEAGDRAARADVTWVRLESGIKAVEVGFRKNDGRATRVGIDVVRDACLGVGSTPP